MFRHSYLAMALGLSLCGGYAVPANAQAQDGRDTAYEAWRNNLGLLRYCRENALLDPIVADRAIRVSEDGLAAFTSASVPSVRDYGDRAENAGAAGLWGANSQRPIANFATLFDTTPSGLCKEWAKESLRGRKARNERRVTPIAATFQVVPQPEKRAVIVEAVKPQAQPRLETPAPPPAAKFMPAESSCP